MKLSGPGGGGACRRRLWSLGLLLSLTLTGARRSLFDKRRVQMGSIGDPQSLLNLMVSPTSPPTIEPQPAEAHAASSPAPTKSPAGSTSSSSSSSPAAPAVGASQPTSSTNHTSAPNVAKASNATTSNATMDDASLVSIVGHVVDPKSCKPGEFTITAYITAASVAHDEWCMSQDVVAPVILVTVGTSRLNTRITGDANPVYLQALQMGCHSPQETLTMELINYVNDRQCLVAHIDGWTSGIFAVKAIGQNGMTVFSKNVESIQPLGSGGNFHYVLHSPMTSTRMDVNIDVWPGPPAGTQAWNQHTDADTALIAGGTLAFVAMVALFIWTVKRTSKHLMAGGIVGAVQGKKNTGGSTGLSLSAHTNHA